MFSIDSPIKSYQWRFQQSSVKNLNVWPTLMKAVNELCFEANAASLRSQKPWGSWWSHSKAVSPRKESLWSFFCDIVQKLWSRALPDITSGPEVRQIFKIRTVRKPDVFLPGRRTFNTFKSIREKKKLSKFFSRFFFSRFFFCLFSNTSQFRLFDTKFVSMEISYDNW